MNITYSLPKESNQEGQFTRTSQEGVSIEDATFEMLNSEIDKLIAQGYDVDVVLKVKEPK